MATTILIELCKVAFWDRVLQRAQDYPETIPVPDDHGRVALHYACENPEAPLEVIQLLATHEALMARDTRTGARPLHTACANKASLDVIKHLARPAVLLSGDHFGKIPLHTACSQQASLEVIQFLVKACPRSLQVPDLYGRLAIHHACDHPRLEVVVFLVTEWPESLKHIDGASELPIHHVCDQSAPVSLVQFLIERQPNSIWAKDYWGHTPLDHWEAHHHNAAEKKMAMMLNPCF